MEGEAWRSHPGEGSRALTGETDSQQREESRTKSSSRRVHVWPARGESGRGEGGMQHF
jgi:hypothetical protein